MSGPEPLDRDARERIRRSLDETLLVEASAGTGKTTELVHRIVNLLGREEMPVERLVAVTFTEKAAGELKLRIREQLERARAEAVAEAGAQTSDTARRGHLDDALARLEEAHINTIHGFCAELLRERPVEAGVDPGFEVLVEAAAERLYERVFDAWFARVLENPPEGIRRALTRRFEDEEETDPGPVDRLRRAGWELATWRDFPTPWRRDPAFDRRAWIGGLRARLAAFGRLTASPARKGDNLAADTGFVRQIAAEIEDEIAHGGSDPDQLEARLIAIARHRDRPRMRKGSGAEFAPGVSRVSVIAERDALFGALDAFARDADADLAALLRDELFETVRLFQEAKTEAGQLDFLDLLIGARDLLCDHAEVRADFQKRFARIFVDEFQDTDPIQAEILMLLTAADPAIDDWRQVAVAPGKLFIVADPKQSIYRFRRADVGTYEDVKAILASQGVQPVKLSTSFRAVPSIQQFVNRVFAPAMQRDETTLQPGYGPLGPWRREFERQPSIVALPVPAPYGVSFISGAAIERSLPDAVGALVSWILESSGWTVTERTTREAAEKRVKVAPRHVCLLFRRFESWGRDVTRSYLEALEARDVPHLLVGGRSFDGREEIETMKAALSAVEWPGDELSVYATLHGALFALSDDVLLRWRCEIGRFDPFRVPESLSDGLADVGDALRTLRRLHVGRNRVPVADTVSALLAATRAHAGLALRPSGEQALANVLHVAELARRYEAGGGISFRGFVEDLVEGRFGDESQAPILEEGGDGVRIMTLHKAKGLEFPIVILCDITANLAARRASRHLDPRARLCAIRLAGLMPHDLLDHEGEELARERAEGLRVAYVAATRARDVLVVPAVGDEPYDGRREKWVSVLNDGLYPSVGQRRHGEPAPGCPAFGSKDTVVNRADGDAARPTTVAPGLFRLPAVQNQAPGVGPGTAGPNQAPGVSLGSPVQNQAPGVSPALAEDSSTYPVVWWDPSSLELDPKPAPGLRETELIGKDASPDDLAADLAAYERWVVAGDATRAAASRPTIVVRPVTAISGPGRISLSVPLSPGTALGAIAHSASSPATASESAPLLSSRSGNESAHTTADDIVVLELPRAGSRVSGKRFGVLVHATLSVVPLDAGAGAIASIVESQARLLAATPDEIRAAVDAVGRVLAHDLLARAREADRRGACRRETPIALVEDGVLLEGQVDLAFEEDGGWRIVDFKTDRDVERGLDGYRRQVALYARAIAEATGRSASGVLLVV